VAVGQPGGFEPTAHLAVLGEKALEFGEHLGHRPAAADVRGRAGGANVVLVPVELEPHRVR
jgi:hypothetical protein